MRPTVSRSSRRGGALILALLFMGVITAGFVTWIGLIRQQARVTQLEQHQARKRLAAANGKLLARDYLLRRVLASNGDDDGLNTTSDAASYGTSTATAWTGNSLTTTAVWTGYAMDSSTRLAGLNGFSPTYDYPYSKPFNFTVSYKRMGFRMLDASINPGREEFANDTTTYRGYLRSRNPVLSGDLLVLHRPTITGAPLPAVTGNVEVEGRVVHFTPEIATASYTARSWRFTSPSVVSGGVPSAINVVPATIGGAGLLWSNLSWFPYSCGNISNPDWATNADDWRLPDFSGQLNFIDNPTTNPSNSLKAELTSGNPTIERIGTVTDSDSRGFSINGTTGIVTITPCAGSTTADLPSIVINNDLTEMIIEGQTGTNFTAYAPYRPALAIVYTQSSTGRNLTTIRLRNMNSRRLVLALKKDHRASWPAPATSPAVNVIVETPSANSEWHAVILSENVPLVFSTTTTTEFNLFGGIQTNAPVSFPASPKLFRLRLQTDTFGLIRLCPRLAWVETFLTGKL
jgi:hypothetical protein